MLPSILLILLTTQFSLSRTPSLCLSLVSSVQHLFVNKILMYFNSNDEKTSNFWLINISDLPNCLRYTLLIWPCHLTYFSVTVLFAKYVYFIIHFERFFRTYDVSFKAYSTTCSHYLSQWAMSQ